MTISRTWALVSAGVALGVAIGAGVVAIAAAPAPQATSVKVCVTKKNVVRSADAAGACPRKTKKKTIGGATAWGHYNGFLVNQLPARSSNVASVSRFTGPEPTAAFYCVKFTQAIPLARRASAVLSRVFGNDPPQNSTLNNHPECPGGLVVRINNVGGPPDHGTFTFVVP